LRQANLAGAQLAGCDLGEAELKGAILAGATYDAQTKWPVDFDPKAAGAVPVR
jgi:uncharacterized protein YjbI with pentapeptide repeats